MSTDIRAVKLLHFIFRAISLLKRTFFSNVQPWRLVYLDSLRLEKRYIPHLKALISALPEGEAQECGNKGTKISERFFKSENSVFLSTSAWGRALWWRPFLTSTASALTLGSIWMPKGAIHDPGGGLNTPFLVFCCARKRSLSFKKTNVLKFYYLYS